MRETGFLEPNKMAKHNIFGQEAEKKAAEYLFDKGYIILEKNWRFMKMEIDIIAKNPEQDRIVVVEVKARKADSLIEPWEAVNKRKMRFLVKAADQYILSNDIGLETRFDIISMHPTRDGWVIEHIDDAFGSHEI